MVRLGILFAILILSLTDTAYAQRRVTKRAIRQQAFQHAEEAHQANLAAQQADADRADTELELQARAIAADLALRERALSKDFEIRETEMMLRVLELKARNDQTTSEALRQRQKHTLPPARNDLIVAAQGIPANEVGNVSDDASSERYPAADDFNLTAFHAGYPEVSTSRRRDNAQHRPHRRSRR
jgi:hypothetical protein